jgi:hypothetical protein
VFTLSKTLDDKCEVDEGDEHDVQFVESGEDPAKIFEASEQPLDLVMALVHFAIVFPRFKAVALWRNNGDEAQIECQLPGFVAFVRFDAAVDWPARGSLAIRVPAARRLRAGRQRE